MKKFLLSLSIIFASGVYVFYQNFAGASTDTAGSGNSATPASQVTVVTNTPQPTAEPVAVPAPVPTPTPTPSPAPTQVPPPVAVTKPKGQYADGSYTGSAADAYYGYIQVQAVISGGKLVDVQFLQYPNDRRTSQYINSQAMPLLKQEAIQAQSANVSGVSGATDSSQAFRQSLGDALSQAKNS